MNYSFFNKIVKVGSSYLVNFLTRLALSSLAADCPHILAKLNALTLYCCSLKSPNNGVSFKKDLKWTLADAFWFGQQKKLCCLAVVHLVKWYHCNVKMEILCVPRFVVGAAIKLFRIGTVSSQCEHKIYGFLQISWHKMAHTWRLVGWMAFILGTYTVFSIFIHTKCKLGKWHFDYYR